LQTVLRLNLGFPGLRGTFGAMGSLRQQIGETTGEIDLMRTPSQLDAVWPLGRFLFGIFPWQSAQWKKSQGHRAVV